MLCCAVVVLCCACSCCAYLNLVSASPVFWVSQAQHVRGNLKNSSIPTLYAVLVLHTYGHFLFCLFGPPTAVSCRLTQTTCMHSGRAPTACIFLNSYLLFFCPPTMKCIHPLSTTKRSLNVYYDCCCRTHTLLHHHRLILNSWFIFL